MVGGYRASDKRCCVGRLAAGVLLLLVAAAPPSAAPARRAQKRARPPASTPPRAAAASPGTAPTPAALRLGPGSASALPKTAPTPSPEAAKPWDRQELSGFMKELAEALVSLHLRRGTSLLKGMVYGYAMPATKQRGYDGAWDTLGDGAWFGNACILAYRVTRDGYYLDLARRQIVPFYLQALRFSHLLYPNRQAAFLDGQPLPAERAKAGPGFLPLWWDDGTGVSFDALASRRTLDEMVPSGWGATNLLRNRSARDGVVAGYAHGTSTRLALSLLPLLTNTWLVTRDPQVAEGLHRLREGLAAQSGADHPLLALGDAVTHGDTTAALELSAPLERVPWPPEALLYQARAQKQTGRYSVSLEGALIDYCALAAAGRVGPGTAQRLARLAWDRIALADLWFGKRKRPAGLMMAVDGAGEFSFEKGALKSTAGTDPSALVGSGLATQVLWASAQSLQLLDAFPQAWSQPGKGPRKEAIPGWTEPPLTLLRARLTREVDGGLRFWRDQLQTVGYLRPDWPLGGQRPKPSYWRDQTSRAAAYAYLLAACATYLAYLEGQRDWELAATVWAPK